MEFKFKIYAKIQKPLAEVFEAVYNPRKLEKYFTTKSASGALDEGATVVWEWAYYPVPYEVHVKKSVKNESIVFEWLSHDKTYTTQVKFGFEALSENETKVSIAESGWQESESGLKNSYDNCSGWTHFLCALKAYVENGINLSDGFY